MNNVRMTQKSIFSKKHRIKMETLRQLVGDSHPNTVLIDTLNKYDYDVGRAANYLLDNPVTAAAAPVASTYDHNNLVQTCLDNMTEWTNVVPTFREIADAPPPEMPLVCFPDIDNGDCVYFCLWQMLHMLVPHATTRSLTKATLGNNMRDYLCQFVQNRWSRISVISNMSWCELVTLSQNTAVSEVETLTYGSWGTTDHERLSAWITERDQMFGGLVDITALVEILAERDVFLSVRIWRKHNGFLTLSTTINAPPGHRYIIADLLHSGQMDSQAAHMRMLSNASFICPAPQPRRRRISKDDDPDYEETAQKKRRKR